MYETDRDDIFAELEHLASTIVPSGRLIDRLESGERRNVTILFLHVGGEAVEDRLQQINEKLLNVFDRVVQKHGGYVDKHFADGLMALFGAKKATGRDASVAVACALEVQSRMKMANEVLSQAGIELGVRTGINTGEVAVGGVGAEREEDFTAYGDAVNTAKRFETACPYGEIYIGDSSRELAGTAFEYVDAGELELKGKAEPVRAWKVKGRSAAVTRRWERKAAVKLGRTFAGRKEELAAFEEIVAKARSRVDNERVPRMTPGAPKALVAAVRGDAGIGKSRLIEQFVKGSEERGTLSVMEHRGEAVRTAGAPYQVLSSAICHFAGTAPLASDSPGKVAEALAILKEESAGTPEGDSLAENLDRIRYLSGDSAAASSVEGLDASALQTALMIAFRSFLEASAVARQAKGSVAVFIADDVQWADKASLEIIHGVLDSLAGHLSIFAIVMSRPEWVVPEDWRKSQELSEFELKPLPVEAADVQLEGLLGEDADIPEDERRWFFARAQGNPFYLEELVLGAIRAGAIARKDGRWIAITPLEEVGLPPTLDELILGHIDSVGDELRTLLQRAAVVGQPFWSNIVSHIYKALKERGEISPRLASLIDLDLIYSETEMAGDAGPVELPYFFRHVLLKDGAYKMLLKVNRKVLHRLAALAIEDIHAGSLAPFYDPLAYHWEKAEHLLNAIRYIARAANAKSRSDPADVLETRTSRGLVLLSKAEKNLPGDRLEYETLGAELYMMRGLARLWRGDSRGAYDDMETALKSSPTDIIKVKALRGMTQVYHLTSDNYAADKTAKEALEIARRIGDKEHLVRSINEVGTSFSHLGDIKKAFEYFESSLALAREIGMKSGAATALANLGNNCMTTGDYERALECAMAACEVYAELGDKHALAINLMCKGNALCALSHREEALVSYRESLELSRETGDRRGTGTCLGNTALTYAEMGDYQQAIVLIEESLAIKREIGDGRGIAWGLLNQGILWVDLGDYECGLEYTLECLALSSKIGDKVCKAAALSDAGLVLSILGRAEEAIQHIADSLELCIEITARPEIASALNRAGVTARSISLAQMAQKCFKISNRLSRAMGLSEFGLPAAIELGKTALREGHISKAEKYLLAAQKDSDGVEAGDLASLAAYKASLLLAKYEWDDALNKVGEIMMKFGSSDNAAAAQTARLSAAEVYLACAKSDPERPDAEEMIEKARRLLDRALGKAEDTGRKIDLPDINNALATACELRGDTEGAEKHRAKAEEIRESFLPDPEEKERLLSELDRLVGEVEAKFLKNEEQ